MSHTVHLVFFVSANFGSEMKLFALGVTNELFFFEDAAIFPRLSLNDPKVRTARREGMPPTEYSALESITRNHYSTISTTWSNIGFLLISIILIGVFQGLANLWGTDANSLPNFS